MVMQWYTDCVRQSVSAFDPTDPAQPLILVDDFGGSAETGELGALGWSLTNGSAAGSAVVVAGHPGITTRSNALTANQVCSVYMGATTGTPYMAFGDLDYLIWVFRYQAAHTDVSCQFGMFSPIGNIAPTGGIYLESLAADTNWFFVTRNASTQTRTDSGVAAKNTNWVTIKIRRIAAGQVGFSINNGAEVTLTTNVLSDTAAINPGQQHLCTAALARAIDLDFFSMKTVPLAR